MLQYDLVFVAQASYALGYNLAIEYLADYEKTWMLDSFRSLSKNFMAAQGRDIDWVFLAVHAEGAASSVSVSRQFYMLVLHSLAQSSSPFLCWASPHLAHTRPTCWQWARASQLQ